MPIVNLKIICVQKAKADTRTPNLRPGRDIHLYQKWPFSHWRRIIRVRRGIRLTLSVNFNAQFEDGLFISDSLCTDAPHPPNNPTSEKIGEGVSVG